MSKFVKNILNAFKSAPPPPPSTAASPEVNNMRSVNAVFAAAKAVTIKPHVPLIKFRKGGGLASVGHDNASRSTPAQAPSPTKSSSARQTNNDVLEDWQLHPRYRRRPLDAKEIEYINRGGPE